MPADGQVDALQIEQRLASTYNHPSYDDPYDAVKDYRRVQRAAANHPDKGSSALSTVVELPRSRIRGWIDDDTDSMPDAARAISVARNRGWIEPSDDTAVALAGLTGHLLGGGSIAEQSYVPSVCEGRRVTPATIERAFDQLGIRSTRRHEDSNNRATEVLPAERASILGRTLAVWGCPVGGRSDMQSLPELLFFGGEAAQEAFLQAYILHRAVNYEQKATTNLQGEQPKPFHRAISELIEAVTSENATYHDRGVTVSAAAMRALNLDE